MRHLLISAGLKNQINWDESSSNFTTKQISPRLIVTSYLYDIEDSIAKFLIN